MATDDSVLPHNLRDPNVASRTLSSPEAIWRRDGPTKSFDTQEHTSTDFPVPILKYTILNEAARIIYGDREKTYGSPDKNLKVIAGLWSAYLERPISIDDVCIMMILLKAARLKTTPDHKDSQVDLCGYAALMERVQDFNKEADMKKQ